MEKMRKNEKKLYPEGNVHFQAKAFLFLWEKIICLF